VLSPVKAEKDEGVPQTLGLSIIIHCSGEVAAFILIKDKLIAAGGVSENKILDLLEGWGSKFSRFTCNSNGSVSC
jgi:hypothetical protein